MADQVVILASSSRPEAYFNIIGHNARQGVRRFVIATLTGANTQSSSELAQNLQINLAALVAGLSRGVHVGPPQDPKPLAQPHEMAAFLEEIKWGDLQFTYLPVQEEALADFLKEHQGDGAAFDVTTCNNSNLADAVAWLVSRGGSPIRTFEILRTQTFDQKDLLPYLSPAQYRYHDLADSQLIRGAIRKVNAGTIHKKRFWWISAFVALAAGAVAYYFPEDLSGPILAAAATFATIVSTVSVIVRNPNI
jgi:hypothetical protein